MTKSDIALQNSNGSPELGVGSQTEMLDPKMEVSDPGSG